MEKIFCKKCKWVETARASGGGRLVMCRCPKNAGVEDGEDTFFESEEPVEIKSMYDPAVLNANNDCNWFEEGEGLLNYEKEREEFTGSAL